MKQIVTASIFIVAFATNIRGQTTQQQVVATSGNYYHNSTAQVSFTVGELLTTTLHANNTYATQGFQQATILVSPPTSIEEAKEQIGVSVYPNPTQSNVSIVIENSTGENLSAQFFDMTGKQVLSVGTLSATNQISLAEFATGNYTLTITNSNKQIVSGKNIIKLQN